MENINITFTVGRLLCGTIRQFLSECKFKGADIEWMESGGLIEHQFIVKGEDSAVRKIANAIKSYGESEEA